MGKWDQKAKSKIRKKKEGKPSILGGGKANLSHLRLTLYVGLSSQSMILV